jgi:hypothetical protein
MVAARSSSGLFPAQTLLQDLKIVAFAVKKELNVLDKRETARSFGKPI